MSSNKYLPHVYVLPEDDANGNIADGFELHLPRGSRRFQVLPSAGGWVRVLEEFDKTYRVEMEKYPYRHMVLLIDFDEQDDRLIQIKKVIPYELANRVFVLGVWSEPEALKRAGLGTYEAIGLKLAQDCRDSTNVTWNHELLQHNSEELRRMTPVLKPILFPPP
ncbi:MAG: hypothetical protein M3Y56_13550 [Armatimonadota bacterium]|nr:hypothetical protein [Armatimonadota bacterium]